MPGLPAPYSELAELLEQQNHTDEAIPEYKIDIARSHDPSEAGRIHNDLGVLYLTRNDTVKALAEFDAADPTEVYALLNRGMFEYNHGQLEAVGEDLVHSVKLMPAPMTWFTPGVHLRRPERPAISCGHLPSSIAHGTHGTWIKRRDSPRRHPARFRAVRMSQEM